MTPTPWRMRVAVLTGACALLAASVGSFAVGATAATCTVMTVEGLLGASSWKDNVSSVQIAAGSCVRFNNQTQVAVTFTVAGGYSQTVPAQQATGTAAGPKDYVGRTAGTFAVHAAGGTASVNGQITVKKATSPSSSPAPRRTSSPPRTSSPRPTTSHGPQVAPSPPAGPKAVPQPVPSLTPLPPSLSPLAGSTGNPPIVQGQPTPTPSSPSPSPSAVAVISGPLQPPTDRGLGLPAALAALAAAGTAAALLRVLLAEPVRRSRPVDTRRSVGGAA